MTTYYWTCPKCGANLDPGEQCDCRESTSEKAPDVATVKRPDKNTH